MNESVEKRKFQRQFLKDLIKGIIINYLETIGRNGYFDNLVLCTYVADDDTLQSEQRCRDKSFTLLPSSLRELSKRIRKQVSIQRHVCQRDEFLEQPASLFIRSMHSREYLL